MAAKEPRTFDALTIIGCIVAVAIMWFGQSRMSQQRADAEKLAAQEQAAKTERELAEVRRVQAQEIKKDPVAAGKAPTPDVKDEPVIPPVIVKATPTDDIAVQGDWIDLVFCSRGAGLKSARLPGRTVAPDGKEVFVDEDAYKKDHKGLDILAEILPGRITFGIPNFEIGPSESEFAITNTALAGNMATLTTSAAHGLLVGQGVFVSGVGAPFDGAAVVLAASDKTVSFRRINPDVPAAPSTSKTANIRATPLILDEKSTDCLDDAIWTPKDSGSYDANGVRTIVYELKVNAPAEYTLTKTFTISKTARFVRCDLKIENKSAQDAKCYYWINGPQGILLDGPPENPKGAAGSRVSIQAQLATRPNPDPTYSSAEPEVKQIEISSAKETADDNRSVSKAENLWGAVKNRFFMAMLISNEPRQLEKIEASFIQNLNGYPYDKRYSEPNIAVRGIRKSVVIKKSGELRDPYAMYLGPADIHVVDDVEMAMKPPAPYYMALSVKFYDLWGWRWSWVNGLAGYMMWLFEHLHKLFGSFGLAVVLMTILIKACLHPVTRKSMISMNKMQKLQPELNKIKEKYKNADTAELKMKMNSEQQDLMRKAGVNPVGGCLPMLVQIPVFTALYGIFNHAFDMRGAEFLWIKDLSQPDRLYTFSTAASTGSWIPSSINLLPIIYIGLSYLQTRMTPQTKSDDPQQEMNRKMMMGMPILISLMFYSMPAGLVLYFAVSACWGMLESWYIKKFLIKDPPPGTGTKAPTAVGQIATASR